VRFIEKTVFRVSNWGGVIGEIFIAAVTVVLITAVLARTFRFVVPGTLDLVETWIVIGIAFSLLKAEIKDHHTRADLLTKRMGRRTRAWVESINTALACFVWMVIAWGSIKLTYEKWVNGEETDFLMLPIPPFRTIWTFACVLLCMILAIKVVRHVKEGLSK
jgi:TRAP-type mannitol/chloroaromatic compound transport system permease small subunit